MAVYLSLFAGAGQQFFTNAGVPLAGGKIYTYGAGGSTPQATYTTSAGNIAHSNPIVLDAAGRVPGGGEIWLTDTLVYKFVLETSAGVTVQTLDNVSASIGSAALVASSGSSLIGFIQAGSGAVARTVQSKLRDIVNVRDFGAIGNGITDDTVAFQNAATTGKPVWVSQGEYLISQPVTFSSGLYGAGAGDSNIPGKTTLTLTGSGQLIVGDWYCEWNGFEVRSAVNNKTMIKNSGQSYWTFTNFVIAKIGAATNQIGIDFDTTSASIYFNRLDNINIRCDYPVKVTGNSTQVFNANKIGMGVGGNKWFDFLSAITVESGVLACDANEFGGYFETGTNVLTFNGVALRQNRFRLIVDAVTRIWNSAVTVTDSNLWEVLDGGFTYQGTQPQNQIFIGPVSTKIKANDTNSTGSIPNATATIMTFDSEEFDTLSEFTPGNGKFQPKFNGYYQVSASAVTAAYTWPIGTRFEIRVYVNGNLYQSGTYAASETASAATIKMTSAVNTLVYLDGDSDYLEIKVISNQGGAISLDSDPRLNFVSITRV